jgi:hypothetical protein
MSAMPTMFDIREKVPYIQKSPVSSRRRLLLPAWLFLPDEKGEP